MKNIFLALTSLLLSTSLFAHSETFTPELVDTLLPSYLEIQSTLAADDLPAAQAASVLLKQTVAQLAPDEEKNDTLMTLNKSAEAISKSKNIAQARESFRTLSLTMIPLIEHVGIQTKQALYVAHCPMAFKGQGADWIQTTPIIANPYYGSQMLRCGSIQTQLSPIKK
ncbi:DUF3347 domain-containing protein [Kiritimatiellota bacterium B12222]|nr:DUF3347 domain-containing protein [Kiritimatiellota bacterium B12222]